ncbi:hypothetical protein G6F32_008538 [Rhizopus arrhizus]|nr:hypothetical protein G6F32_008538 [Rhizopus arrhizus]
MWKPDTTHVAIKTSKNYLLLYSVLTYDQHSFEFNFPNSTHAIMNGPGEGKGPRTMLLRFRLAIRVDAGIVCGTSLDDTLIIVTHSPPAIQCISWNPHQVNKSQSFLVSKMNILEKNETEQVISVFYEKSVNLHVWLSSEGKAYLIENKNNNSENKGLSPTATNHRMQWSGVCFHGKEQTHLEDKATSVSINSKFSLIAVGTRSGVVYVYSTQSHTTPPVLSHKLQLTTWKKSVGSVSSLCWTSDGHAISVGYKEQGLSIWSVYGSMLFASNELDEASEEENLKDTYMKGVRSLFWGPGNHQLFILSTDEANTSNLFALPFVKSALTSYLHSDNAKRGLLQMDDRMLLYNNSRDYQENNTAIDPAAVAWTHIQYPALYITDNWPIRYSSISSDGNYIAVAGKRGFAHYNTISNRWKLFGNQQQEQSFLVKGGIVWYKTILIVSCENIQQKTYEIRLYSRDNNLDNHYVLFTEVLLSTPVYIALCGDFLLVYTLENYYNKQTHKLYKIGTHKKDIIQWNSHLRIKNQLRSIEDVVSSNILLLVGGKLIILCSNEETEDLGSASSNPFKAHIMSQNTEYYWIGKRSVENLRTSLWIMNGRGLKVFTNFLLPDEFEVSSNIYSESEPTTPTTPGYLSPRHDVGRPFTLGYHMDHEPESPTLTEARIRWRIDDLENLNKEAIYMPLDFYPISILLEGGIIVGIEQNVSYNASLGLVLFKMSPKMHLFLHHIFRHLLQIDLEQDAITFARAYEKYVYFGHALEILLHTVLEEEAGQDLKDAAILPLVIKFLDQFRHALDVIVSCARKTEVALWEHLFSVVGKPKDLFEICLEEGRLHTATSYLIILQTMQPLAVAEKDTMRLLNKALDENNYELCKELIRFLSSIDSTGNTLHEALRMIKTRIETNDPISPNTFDNQMDKVVQN